MSYDIYKTLNYQSPLAEVLEIETEQCFAVSSPDMNFNEEEWS